MTEEQEFYQVLGHLHKPFDEDEDVLEAIVRLSCEALRSPHAGVMLVHADGSVESAAVSDELVSRADQLQLSLREGPCLSAVDGAHVEVIARTSAEPRWPHWGPAADAIGIRSVLSVRLAHGDADPIGSLNVYYDVERAFDDEDIEVAKGLARHAEVQLAAVGKLQQMDQDLDSVAVIRQAEGVMMMLYGIRAHEAFDRMIQYARNHELSLREVAARVVRDRGMAAPPDDPK